MITGLPFWVLAAFVGHAIRTGHAVEYLAPVLEPVAAVLEVLRGGRHARPFSAWSHVPFAHGNARHIDVGLAESAPTPITKLEPAR